MDSRKGREKIILKRRKSGRTRKEEKEEGNCVTFLNNRSKIT